MPQGYGSGPAGYGSAGLRIDPPRAGSPVDQMADDIRAIRARFCLPNYSVKTPFNIAAAGGIATVDLQNAIINAFCITVVTGTVSIWEGRQNPNSGTIGLDRKSTRLNSSHIQKSRMPSSA